MSSIEYLDEERKKMWARITELENEIDKKIPEWEKEAKQESKKTSEFRNRSEEAKDAAIKAMGEAQSAAADVHQSRRYIDDIKNEVTTLLASTKETVGSIDTEYLDLVKRKQELVGYINELQEIFKDEEDINEKLRKLNENVSNSSDLSTKVSVAHKNIIERKNEIDEVYYEILGYTDEDEEGNERVVSGLKQQLESSFKEINIKIQDLLKHVEDFSVSNAASYTTFQENKEGEYKSTLDKWINEYISLKQRIETLLPNALTAGLSSAYSNKKEDEVKESEKFATNFRNAVFGLIAVSLIPFIVSAVELYNQTDLQQVLLGLPRLALAILPIYIPVLWLAYSANKKRNLSKRLIEEYTHKEVLSKTYEGLSAQINNIEDKLVSSDLRNRLLYTILEVSSENPGKLISDYEKSDHPLMDALDKSIKLGSAVDKLSKIPGFSRLAKTIDKRSKQILAVNDKYANEGLDQVEDDNDDTIRSKEEA
jgi:hypothetical protein